MSSENSPGLFPRPLTAYDPEPFEPNTAEVIKLKDDEYDAYLKARHQLIEVENQAARAHNRFCDSITSLGMRWQETVEQHRVYKKRHEDIFGELATILGSPLKAHFFVPFNKHIFLPPLYPYCETRDFKNRWKIRITPDWGHPWHEAWMANPDMVLDSAESADSLPPNSLPERDPYRVPRTRENPWGDRMFEENGIPIRHWPNDASSTKASGSGSGFGALSPKKDKGQGKAKATSPGPSSSSSATANRVSKPATAAQRATVKRSQVKKGKYWAFKAEQHLLAAAGLDDSNSDDSDDSDGGDAKNNNDKFFVLACPAPELLGVCQADTPNFNRHPFKRNRAVEHFRECGVEVEGEEDIFARFVMEVVQDTARWPVNEEWARKHNQGLIGKRDRDGEEAMEDLE